MKKLQQRTVKTATKRSENIKVKLDTLKQVHLHVKEVGDLKKQV